jgi:hypothetical protein
MKRQFGRYVIADEVLDELGRGAFGRVYRAFDPNVNRYVAVKVLSSGSDPDLLNRFRDESKTAGKLEHENVVKVYDFDLQDDMPYLVMELLGGDTLEKVIRSRMVSGRPLQLLDAVEIMFQVAKGLQYAHSRNVIHRDIKPGNIMVLPSGTAKVMDFGIARVVDKDGTRRTRQGDMAGTILYMAPEQFKGHDADRGSDIFAYADIYYELLTGEHPFFAKDPGTVMYRITACDPPPIRERLPECPAHLEAMIQRLMSKDREARPDTLEEVLIDTQPILQQLRQERAAALAAAIPALIEAGDSERAQAAIRQALELDPLNSAARQLREQLLEEDRRRITRAKAQALARKGDEHAAARRFSEAVQCFEGACALQASDASLRDRLEQAKLSAENVHAAARLLSEAREELQQGRLEAALRKSEQAFGLDAGNQEAAQFGREARRRIEARRDAAALVRAEQHRSRGEYREALAVLEGIEAGSAAETEAAILRGRVEEDRAEAERRRRHGLFERGLSAARKSLVSERLEEALASAEALCAEYPEESAAADFLSEVRERLAAKRRMEAVGKIMQSARGLIDEERFSDARELIESGLRSYPGEAGLSRLLQAAAALGAARERARQIGRILEQTHSLAAERRLYGALVAVDRAIAEFGNEAALAQRKRDLELECARAEYGAGLRKTIEGARRLLAEERPADAAALLEEARFRFPGEAELAELLSAARSSAEERSFVPQTLSRIAALEQTGQLEAAAPQLEAALARYPANADLRAAAERLRQELRERERSRMVTSRIGRIEEAIHSGDWARAETECQDALRVFPGEEALAPYPARIQEGRRQVEIQVLQLRVQASLRRQDPDDAERQLDAVREIFSQEPVWQDLWRECQSRKQYRDNLALALSALSRKDYALAEEILRPLLAGAPDDRAANLHGEVAAERERAAIARGRADAARLCRRADYEGASALLDRLSGQYPGDAWVQQDREAVRHQLERQRREAEERAERQAIAAGRREAAELLRNGDPQGALAILDRLSAKYPDAIEIRQDRDAAALEGERLRLEAEEREREGAIAEGRAKAAAQVRQGNHQAAIALLYQLAAQYPGDPGIKQDLEAVWLDWDRDRREAEEQARR